MSKLPYKYMDSETFRKVYTTDTRSKMPYAVTVWSRYVRSHIELLERSKGMQREWYQT